MMINNLTRYTKSLKAFVFLISSFFLLVSGCTLSTKYNEENVEDFITPSTSPTTTSLSELEVTPTPLCVLNRTFLTQLAASGIEARKYHWSDDGKHFYFQSAGDWWEYSVESKETTLLTDLQVVATQTPSPIMLMHRFNLGENYELLRSNSSLSPSGTKLVYWDIPNRSELKTPTPGPAFPFDDLPHENYKAIEKIEQDIFLLLEGHTDPIYLGQIHGLVKNAYWFQGENKAVLEMLYFSPYYLWLIDIPGQSLMPFLSREEISDTPTKFAVLDISPDENWVLYQATVADNVFFINTNDFSIRPLYDIPRSIGAWWLPDSSHIVAIVRVETGDYSVLLYDMKSEELTQIASDLGNRVFDVSLGVSEDQVVLTYIVRPFSGLDELYMVDLCLEP